MLGITVIVCVAAVAGIALICVFSYLGCVGQAKIEKAAAESTAYSERAMRNCQEEEIKRLQAQIEKILEKQPTVAIKNV